MFVQTPFLEVIILKQYSYYSFYFNFPKNYRFGGESNGRQNGATNLSSGEILMKKLIMWRFRKASKNTNTCINAQ